MAHGNLVLLLVFLFVSSCYAINFVQCPDHEGCSCDQTEIICDCSTANSIGEVKKKVVVSENTSPNLIVLIVRNCEVVEIAKYALTNAELKHIEFSNIVNMSIYHLGINIAKDLDLIRFKNIDRMLLGRFAVAYVTNLKKFEIINVTSPGFPLTAFFELDGIHDFLIEDSNIGVLQSHAITVRNGSSFTISNSSFNVLSNASIVVKDFQQFIIKDSFINTWQDNGIGSLNAGQIQLTGNTVNNTGKGFLYVSGAAELIIQDNQFHLLKSGALDEVFKTSYISFIDNKISMAMPESIGDYFNDSSKKVKIVSVGNEFHCGCGIEWLVLRMTGNMHFLNDNVCVSPFSNVRISLSNLTFVDDSDGNCLSFVEPEFPIIVTTTELGNLRENFRLDGGNHIDSENDSINKSRLSDNKGKISDNGAIMASVNFWTTALVVLSAIFYV